MRVWQMEATIRDVHDGDTLSGWVDQGMGQWNHGASRNGMGLRLDGVNARELGEAGGHEARDYLASLIPVGTVVPISVVGWDKYANRIDVQITLPDIGDLADHLVGEMWAAPYPGFGPKLVPPWPRPQQGGKG